MGDGFKLGRWVAQGGFAGEGVVPSEKQLPQFKGMSACPTWNFLGNIPAAQAALSSSAIGRKVCVSKNVCHAVVYDAEWHQALKAALEAEQRLERNGRGAVALGIMYKATEDYLAKNPGGKKLHDPLALAVALDESVCELVEVELFYQKGKWGSRLSPGSDIWISTDYDNEKFQTTLLPALCANRTQAQRHRINPVGDSATATGSHPSPSNAEDLSQPSKQNLEGDTEEVQLARLIHHAVSLKA